MRQDSRGASGWQSTQNFARRPYSRLASRNIRQVSENRPIRPKPRALRLRSRWRSRMPIACCISASVCSRRCRSAVSISSACNRSSRKSAGWGDGTGCRADLMPSLSQRAFAEGLGTAFLLAAVVGSGIMAQKPFRRQRRAGAGRQHPANGRDPYRADPDFRPHLRRTLQSGGSRAAGSQGQSSPCHKRRAAATHPRFELGSWKDAVSATRRFESSSPSQPVRSLRCDFQVWENRRRRAAIEQFRQPCEIDCHLSCNIHRRHAPPGPHPSWAAPCRSGFHQRGRLSYDLFAFSASTRPETASSTANFACSTDAMA
jgi:hypothetical protein